MVGDRGFLPEEIDHYIEILGIYDGWSVAKMKDGRLLNRWPPDDRRHKPTQDWIASFAATHPEGREP